MNHSDRDPTLPWTRPDLDALQQRLLEARRLLAAFPEPPDHPCLLRRAPNAEPESVEALPLAGEVIVGRKGDGPFAVPDDALLSARHFRLVVGPEGVCYAEDLDSTNGLWINGRRVRQRLLVHGDLIRAGHQEFVFHHAAA